MDKEPSQGGWSFPDVGNWDALDPDPPAVHVEFVVDDRSDEALIPFRMGASAFGAPLSQGDRPLAAWIARIARTLDRLAAGELIAYAGIGNRVQLPREVWDHEVVVVRESHRPWDAEPRRREDRYKITRREGRIMVNLGPEPFAAPGHLLDSIWVEIEGERQRNLRLFPPSQMARVGVGDGGDDSAEPAPAASGAGPQAREQRDRPRLLNKVKDRLRAEAVAEEPRNLTKPEWADLMRREIDKGIRDHLFNEAWRQLKNEGALPPSWTAPGRRLAGKPVEGKPNEIRSA